MRNGNRRNRELSAKLNCQQRGEEAADAEAGDRRRAAGEKGDYEDGQDEEHPGSRSQGVLGKLFATPPARTVRATRSANIRDPARIIAWVSPLSSVESSRMISPVGACIS